MRILFVCLGNICRSPMAEAVMRDLIKKEHISDIQVDSAGTGSWHVGEPPHRGTLKILKSKNISAHGLIGRQIQQSDAKDFDLILGMDTENVRDLQKILPKEAHNKIKLFMSFAGENASVPDPYYSLRFDETYEMVKKGCEALLSQLESL